MGDSGFLILRRNVNVDDAARLLGTLDLTPTTLPPYSNYLATLLPYSNYLATFHLTTLLTYHLTTLPTRSPCYLPTSLGTLDAMAAYPPGRSASGSSDGSEYHRTDSNY